MKRLLVTVILAVFLLCLLLPLSVGAARLPIVTFRGYDGNLTDLVDGYLLDDSANLWFTPGLITWQTYRRQAPQFFSTRAIYQSRGVMEATAQYNGVNLSDVAGGIALIACTDVGRTAWIQPPGGHWLKTRVADCTHRLHSYFHVAYVQSAVELQYSLAEQLNATGYNTRGGVGIWGLNVCMVEAHPESICMGHAPDFTDWWLGAVDFE